MTGNLQASDLIIPAIIILTAFAYFFGKIVVKRGKRKKEDEKDILIGGFVYFFIAIALPTLTVGYGFIYFQPNADIGKMLMEILVGLTASFSALVKIATYLSAISLFPNIFAWISFNGALRVADYFFQQKELIAALTPLIGILLITKLAPWMKKNKKRLGIDKLWVRVCFSFNLIAIVSMAYMIVNGNWIELGVWMLFGLFALWAGAYILSEQLELDEIYGRVRRKIL
ncbi:Uncharacterised protein [uncultured archaeon]|nr:Uncharacterised protein [uncultured archaeon]